MTTVAIILLLSLCFSLLLTPWARWFGIKYKALDVPDSRKIHKKPTPRTGGVAIFSSFALSIIVVMLFEYFAFKLLQFDKRFFFFFCGGLIAFAIGLLDDFSRVKAPVKLLFQIAAASVAYFGGVQILKIGLITDAIPVGIFSYVLTVFWFVFIINGINLADGIDGLAGGIVVFTSLVMVIFCIFRHNYFIAMLFSIITGSTLGFLKYNFNPATIFLGDGGSYFLGYAIAGLSIMATVKAEMGALLLIPPIALGIPLFDTALAPFRRFIRGRKIFAPDREHIHHKLIDMGFGSKKVVWLLYGITCCLCVFAFLIVNFRDERSGLFLIVLGAGALVFVGKLGYFEYFSGKKFFGWIKDVSDVAGISHERRSFLNVQMDLNSSKNLEMLWQNMIRGFQLLEFDMGKVVLRGALAERVGVTEGKKGREAEGKTIEGWQRIEELASGEKAWERCWWKNVFDGEKDLCGECLLKLELPLLTDGGENIGTIFLMKDLKQVPVTHYTLRRVEHLRRTLISTLLKLRTR